MLGAGPPTLAPDLKRLGEGEWDSRPEEWWAMQISIPGTPLREVILEAVWRDEPVDDPKRNPCRDKSVAFGYLVDDLRGYDEVSDTDQLPTIEFAGALTDGKRPQWLLWGSPVRKATSLGTKEDAPEELELLYPASHPEGGFDGYTIRKHCGP